MEHHVTHRSRIRLCRGTVPNHSQSAILPSKNVHFIRTGLRVDILVQVFIVRINLHVSSRFVEWMDALLEVNPFVN